MIKTALFASAISLAVLTTSISSASAEQVASVASESRTLTVAKDKSVAFRLDAAVGELVVSGPDIAEIVAKTDHSFYIRGKKTGSTNVLVYGPNQQLLEVIDVRVGPDIQALRQDLAASMPGENIQVAYSADGLTLSGAISNSAVATRAKAVALRYAPDSVSTNFAIHDPQQVILEVRVIEAGRQALRDAGISLNVMGATGSLMTGAGLLGITPPAATLSGPIGSINGVQIDAVLQALEDKGTIRTLAKPNLVALSGEEATFLAGGEFPLAVPQQLNIITIEFKPFGVALKFTPDVQDNGSIKLKIAPEVSAIDDTHPLKINGYNVPSLTVRRASTTVQLDPGKSFAIAGLLQQSDITSIRQTPFAGDIPILGELFRSTRFNRQETELVIIVTPRLVNVDAPLPNPFHDGAAPIRPYPRAAPLGETSQPGMGAPGTSTLPGSTPPPRQRSAPASAPPPAPAPAPQPIAEAPAAPAPVAAVIAPAQPAAAQPVAVVAPAPAPVQPVQPAPAQVATIAIPSLPTPPRPPAPPPVYLKAGRPIETVLTPVSAPIVVEDPYQRLSEGSGPAQSGV